MRRRDDPTPPAVSFPSPFPSRTAPSHSERRTRACGEGPKRGEKGATRVENGGPVVTENPTEGNWTVSRLSTSRSLRLFISLHSLPHSSSLIHPLPFPLVSLPPGGRGGAGETWGMGWGWVTNGMRSRRASCLYVGRCLSSTSLTRHGLGVREGIYRDINNSLYLYISLHNKLINTRGNW